VIKYTVIKHSLDIRPMAICTRLDRISPDDNNPNKFIHSFIHLVVDNDVPVV